MKSRTLSCKKTAFRKNITRFAPVWGGWLLFLLLILLTMSADEADFWFPSNLANSLQVMGVFTCGYALLVTQVLFGDLYNSRMCNALHAMPLKRSGWYAAHVKAGLWFCLVPTAVVAVLASLWIGGVSAMEKGWMIPLYWWVGTNLSYLFFFGVGVFSALCVGNRFGMAVVYGTLNFASVLLMFLIDSLYVPLLHGMLTPFSLFTPFCPMYHSTNLDYIDCFRKETGNFYIDAFGVQQKEQIYGFTVKPEGWQYLLIVAGVGLVLLVLSRWLYQRRKLECAGDFAATPALVPVFQGVMTLMITSGFGVLYAMLFGDSGLLTLYVGVGLFIGWFVAKMLLKRSTRVFAPRNFVGLGILAVLLALSLFVTKLDPLGLESWMPQVSQVKNARIFLQGYGEEFTTDDPREIAELLRIHDLALEDRITQEEYRNSQMMEFDEETGAYGPEKDPMVCIRMEYTLSGGIVSRREYYIRTKSEEGQLTRRYFSDLRALMTGNSDMRELESEEQFLAMASDPKEIILHHRALEPEFQTEEYVQALLNAIVADCRAGNMVQHSSFHDAFFHNENGNVTRNIYLELHLANGHWFSIAIYPDCENTLAILEQTGIPQLVREGEY